MIRRSGHASLPTPVLSRLLGNGLGVPSATAAPPAASGRWSGWEHDVRLWRFCLALLLSLIVAAPPAHAVRPDEMLKDPVREARAREVSKELRCLVCRNQSIDDSDADLAHDLRVLVRERITAGDTNDQVLAYVRARYGDFVLLKPPFEWGTALLWGGPFLLLLFGAVLIRRWYRRQPEMTVTPPLTAEERQRLDTALAEGAER
jgi:cytochrome c-type biogenesis protein CcmH